MSRPYNTKLTKEQRSERARKAGRAYGAKTSPEQRSENARKAALARSSLDAHIAAIVARASELTTDQVAIIRRALDS